MPFLYKGEYYPNEYVSAESLYDTAQIQSIYSAENINSIKLWNMDYTLLLIIETILAEKQLI